MKNIFRNLYYSIICYDPIIESLHIHTKPETRIPDTKTEYLASPVLINRKQKRNFKYSQEKNNKK